MKLLLFVVWNSIIYYVNDVKFAVDQGAILAAS